MTRFSPFLWSWARLWGNQPSPFRKAWGQAVWASRRMAVPLPLVVLL